MMELFLILSIATFIAALGRVLNRDLIPLSFMIVAVGGFYIENLLATLCAALALPLYLSVRFILLNKMSSLRYRLFFLAVSVAYIASAIPVASYSRIVASAIPFDTQSASMIIALVLLLAISTLSVTGLSYYTYTWRVFARDLYTYSNILKALTMLFGSSLIVLVLTIHDIRVTLTILASFLAAILCSKLPLTSFTKSVVQAAILATAMLLLQIL